MLYARPGLQTPSRSRCGKLSEMRRPCRSMDESLRTESAGRAGWTEWVGRPAILMVPRRARDQAAICVAWRLDRERALDGMMAGVTRIDAELAPVFFNDTCG